jgi:NADH dehydrogenase (ubiquinone) Fe-S protein 6
MDTLGEVKTTRYLAGLWLAATPEFGNTAMPIAAPETRYIDSRQVACDGDDGPLGHPRVYLKMPTSGDSRDTVTCGYCDRRFILAGGIADTRSKAA